MVRVVMSEKNPVNIVVGDPQMQKLLQGSIAEINQGVCALFLNEYARRITIQRWHRSTRTQYCDLQIFILLAAA